METDKTKVVQALRDLSENDFLSFGVDRIGYIKPFESGEFKDGYALYAANGTLLSVQDNFDIIVMLAHENDIRPVTVH